MSLQPRLRLPTAGPHLVVGDSLLEHTSSAGNPAAAMSALHRSPDDLRSTTRQPRAPRSRGLHVARRPRAWALPRACTRYAGPESAETAGRRAGPDVAGLDDVRIEVHDPGDLGDVCFEHRCRHHILYPICREDTNPASVAPDRADAGGCADERVGLDPDGKPQIAAHGAGVERDRVPRRPSSSGNA